MSIIPEPANTEYPTRLEFFHYPTVPDSKMILTGIHMAKEPGDHAARAVILQLMPDGSVQWEAVFNPPFPKNKQ